MFYNYEITKEFHFSASHQLDYLPEGHQCKRLHGHNYIVKVTLAQTNSMMMVLLQILVY